MFIEEAIKRYIEDHTSLRNIARRMDISPTTVLSWVSQVGQRCKDSVEIASELKPCWSGVVGIDGKPIKVNGEEMVALLAIDFKTKDLVHIDLVNTEDEEGMEKFLKVLRDSLKYPFSFIVSDLGKGKVLINLVKRLFPNIPHQGCVVHFMRYVNMRLPKSKKSKFYKQNKFLREQIKKILFADTLKSADNLLEELLSLKDNFKVKYQKSVIKSLCKYYPLLTAHFHYSHMPRDNNIVENIIKQLNKKLKQVYSFKSKDNAYNFLKLWAVCYRFKPFTGSKYNNGLAPLEIANVNLKGIDWLRFSKSSRPS